MLRVVIVIRVDSFSSLSIDIWPLIVVNLRARAAGTCITHCPEVFLIAKTENALPINAYLFPQLSRFVRCLALR